MNSFRRDKQRKVKKKIDFVDILSVSLLSVALLANKEK